MNDHQYDYDGFWDDALAYLDWAIKAKRSPSEILSVLMHDIGGVARKDKFFVPKVTGWAKAKKAKADGIE